MPGLKLGKEAQAKFNEARTSPDKAGFLDKKGAKRKNWNERWFVLKDNYLFYCKNDKSNPQGIINLHGCTVSQIQGPTARPNSFSLLAPKSVSIDAKWTNRTYFMAAKDPKEMEHWKEKLEESGRRAVERAAAKKSDTPKETETPKKDDSKPNAEVKEVKVEKKSEYDNDISSDEEEKPKPKESKAKSSDSEEEKKVEVKKVVEEEKKEDKEPKDEKKKKKKKSSKKDGAERKEKKEKKKKKSSSKRELTEEKKEEAKEEKKKDSSDDESDKEEERKKEAERKHTS